MQRGDTSAGMPLDRCAGSATSVSGAVWSRPTTLKTGQLLSVEVTRHDCDSQPSAALDGQLVVPRLVTAFADADAQRRGLHMGDFEWQGTDALVRGTLSGITNMGTHRESHFDQFERCERCDEKYGPPVGLVGR